MNDKNFARLTKAIEDVTAVKEEISELYQQLFIDDDDTGSTNLDRIESAVDYLDTAFGRLRAIQKDETQ